MTRQVLPLLLIVCAAAPLAAAADAIALLDGCIHRLDPTSDVGYARIAEQCPDLVHSLASGPYAAWLPPDWNKPENGLSVGGLVELRQLLTRPAPAVAAHAPRVARLTVVLAELQHRNIAEHGWWDRLKQWMRELFAPQSGSAEAGWLQRMFGGINVSQGVMRAIVWIALLLLLLLAGGVVVNELRIAGLWPRGRRRGHVAPSSARAGTGNISVDDLLQASPDEQPQLLLGLIIHRLREQQRLPPAGALTLRELERAARLGDERDRGHLAALTAACERLRFAENLAVPVRASALVRGRQLLASLEAPSQRLAGAS